MPQSPAPGRLPPLAVIADDLTGSCDTAAQFSRFGMRVAVTGASAPGPAPRPRPAGGQHGLARAARRTGSRSGGALGQSTAGFRQPTGLQEDRLDAQGPLVPGTGRGHGLGPARSHPGGSGLPGLAKDHPGRNPCCWTAGPSPHGPPGARGLRRSAAGTCWAGCGRSSAPRSSSCAATCCVRRRPRSKSASRLPAARDIGCCCSTSSPTATWSGWP